MNKKIGLIISTLDTDSSINLYRGIIDEAKERGFSTCVCMVRSSSDATKVFCDGEYSIFDTIDYNWFDAIIIAPYTIDMVEVREKMMDIAKNYTKPVIAIDCDIQNAYKIESSNYEVQREIVEHLINVHGVKKINYVSGPLANEEARLRCDGFIDVMKENGIYNKDRIYEGTFYLTDGKKAVSYFDENEETKDYEAIVCANDMSALAVEEELLKRGKHIPNDVIVTGIDDIYESRALYPQLTTASKSNNIIGRTAVKMLEDIWDGKKVTKISNIKPTMFFRASCGCASEDSFERKTVMNYASNKMMSNSVRGCVDECSVAADMQEYIEIMYKYMSVLSPNGFLMHIDEDFADDLGIEDTITVKNYEFANDKVYRIAMAYLDGEIKDVTSYKLLERIDKWFVETRHEFFCTPIHFQEVCYGFILFDKTDFPFRDGVYWEWVMGISTSLNSLRYRQKMDALSRKDPLTGLNNRYGLEYYGSRFVKLCNQRKHPMMFLFVDLDRLKYINDTFGHEEGDYAIAKISQILLSFNKKKFIAVRYGGDEFLLIGYNIDEEGAKKIKQDINRKIDLANIRDKKKFDLSASMGYFIREVGDSSDMETCIQFADEIMYKEKLERKKMNR